MISSLGHVTNVLTSEGGSDLSTQGWPYAK